jgi:ppGpp synthetase/RelA/SpoT-type nucleotidyltranferase
MDKDKLKTEYNSNVSLYKALENEALFIINDILNESKIKIHLVISRIKDFESFYDKVERKQIKKPFAEIMDIVGLRVVCLFLSDIEQIGNLIKSSFKVLDEDNKINGFDSIASFGYMSLHFIVKMRKEYTGPRYDKVRDIPFEIQVRTISMDAWANVSHYLSYKTETDVPKNLKRDFYALSGLFYVADTHFELFSKESKKSQQNIQKRVATSLEDTSKSIINEEINMDSLKAYFSRRFHDRNYNDDKDLSELIMELYSIGIYNISQLEEMYNLTWNIFLLYEKEYPPGDGEKYVSIGVVRKMLDLTNEKYREKYDRERFMDEKYIDMMNDKIASQKQKGENHEK